jgi:putative membrane protein
MRQEVHVMHKTIIALAAALAAAPIAAHAQSDTQVSTHDVLFVMDASLNNAAEIELGRLAARHARNPDIRAFGERMAAEHEDMQDQLGGLAGDVGIALPARFTDVPEDDVDVDPDVDTPEFDLTYIAGQVAAHRRAIELFMRQRSYGQNAELREMARDGVPQLRDHLREALRLTFVARRDRVVGSPLPPLN